MGAIMREMRGKWKTGRNKNVFTHPLGCTILILKSIVPEGNMAMLVIWPSDSVEKSILEKR